MFMEASSPQAADGRLSTPEVAVVGGGCFWCTEAIFLEAAGVLSVTPGYAGGSTGNPTYKQVVSGKTGHAEVGVTCVLSPSQHGVTRPAYAG